MSSPFDNIIQVQQKILKESKRSLESEKLQLWSYKADLNTTSISLKRFQSQIEIQEQKFYQLNEEARISVHELEYTTEVLSPHILSLVLQIKNPWKIIRDVCGGISQILGFTDTSWEGFQVFHI